MSFKDKVEEKKKRRMARPPELTVKDWISNDESLRTHGLLRDAIAPILFWIESKMSRAACL